MTFTLTGTSGPIVMEQSANTTTLSPMPQPVNIDALIDEMWKVCLDQDDESTVDIHARHDMWWGVYAECSHGHFHGYSNGTNDLSNGFLRLHAAFMEGHAS